MSQPLDLDCISSGIVVKKYLESLNKKVTLNFPREITEQELEFIRNWPHTDEIITQDSAGLVETDKFDTLILVDGANTAQFHDKDKNERLPNFSKIPTRIRIDHRLASTKPWDNVTCYVNSNASSTIEVLLDGIIPVDFLPKDLATLAYAGLHTDTGGFSWNFRPKTLRLAADVVAQGANIDLVTDILYSRKTHEWLEAEAYAIKNTNYYPELSTQILKLDIEELGEEKMRLAKNAFTGEIARKVKGYKIGFVLRHAGKGVIKVSARGNNLTSNINLPEFFENLGYEGGGHKQKETWKK